MSGLSKGSIDVLTEAGWRAGRRVETSSWRTHYAKHGLVMHDAADWFLSEFGGLSVGTGLVGVTGSRVAFDIDPALCYSEEDRFSDWSAAVGKVIFSLGELDQGRYFLGLDEGGVIYVVTDVLAHIGSGFDGLGSLISGAIPQVLYDRFPRL